MGRPQAAREGRTGQTGTTLPPCAACSRSAAVAGPLAALAALLLAFPVSAAGPPFPSPIAGQAVYDGPGALHPGTVAHLETEIDRVETRSGAEIAVYIQVDPSATEASNLQAARALMDQWGVGRSGFDDGLVILLGLQPDLVHGKVSLYAGSGFKSAYLDEDQLAAIIAADFVPSAAHGDLDAAMLSTVAAVDNGVTSGGRARLERARVVDALLASALPRSRCWAPSAWSTSRGAGRAGTRSSSTRRRS